MIADKPGAVTLERGPAQVVFDHVDFRYPSPEEVSLASLESRSPSSSGSEAASRSFSTFRLWPSPAS